MNQDGDRLHEPEANVLTVIATEPYEEFAENLQREIEEETGIRFGIVDKFQFADIVCYEDDGSVQRCWVLKGRPACLTTSKQTV